MKAVLLCAGYGTRLYPLTRDKPKHLLDVGGKPILEHLLDKVQDVDAVDSVYLVTNAKFFYSFLEWAKDYAYRNPRAKRIEILNDGTDSNDARLGALGDVLFAIKKKGVKEDLLLIAADNLFDFQLTGMKKLFDQKGKTVIALFDVKDRSLARHYGVVQVDGDSKLVHFVEKPEHPQSTLVSTGIYFLPQRDLRLLDVYVKYGYSTDKIGSFFEWLHKKEDVYCYTALERWYDIGTKEQLEEASRHYAQKQVLL